MLSLVDFSLLKLLSVLLSVINCALCTQTVSWDQLQLLSPQLQLFQTHPLSVAASSQPLQPFSRYPAYPNSQVINSNSAQPLASIQYELKILQQKTPLFVSNPIDSVANSATLPSASLDLNAEDRGVSSSESRPYGSVPPVKKILHIHHYHHEHRTNGELNEATTRAQERQQEKATEALVEKQVQEEVVKNLEREQMKDVDHHGDQIESKPSKKSAKNFEINDIDEPWKPVHKFKRNYSPSQSVQSKTVTTNSVEEQPGIGYHEDYAPYVHFHQQARSNSFGRRRNRPKSNRLMEKNFRISQAMTSKNNNKESSESIKLLKNLFNEEKHKRLLESRPQPGSNHKRPATPHPPEVDDDEPPEFPEKQSRGREMSSETGGPEYLNKESKDGEDVYTGRFSLQPSSADSDESSSAEGSAGEGNDYGFNDESDIGSLDNLHSDTRQVSHKSRKRSAARNIDLLPPSPVEQLSVEPRSVEPIPLQVQLNRDMPTSRLNNSPSSTVSGQAATHPHHHPSSPALKSGLKRNWLGLELITRNN